MKLIDLIEYLINPEKLETLYKSENLNMDSDALLIYMEKSLDLNSNLKFFEIEETEDNLMFEKDNIKYIQFFPFDYAVELIENDLDLKNKGLENIIIAKRLLEYRLRDA